MITLSQYVIYNHNNLRYNHIVEINENFQIVYEYINNSNIYIYRYCYKIQQWYWILMLAPGWDASEYSYNICDLNITQRLFHRIFHISTNEYDYRRFCGGEYGNYTSSYKRILNHIYTNLQRNLLFKYIIKDIYQQWNNDKFLFYQWYQFKQLLFNFSQNINFDILYTVYSLDQFIQMRTSIDEERIYQLIDLDNNNIYYLQSDYDKLNFNNCCITNIKDNNNKYFIIQHNQFYIYTSYNLEIIHIIKFSKCILSILSIKYIYQNNIAELQLCNSYLAHRINRDEYQYLLKNWKKLIKSLINKINIFQRCI